MENRFGKPKRNLFGLFSWTFGDCGRLYQIENLVCFCPTLRFVFHGKSFFPQPNEYSLLETNPLVFLFSAECAGICDGIGFPLLCLLIRCKNIVNQNMYRFEIMLTEFASAFLINNYHKPSFVL